MSKKIILKLTKSIKCLNFQVCLIHYENTWSIWFLDVEGGWTWLADSFVYYFRMALVHQGLPGWQAIFTKMGLSPWAEVISYNYVERSTHNYLLNINKKYFSNSFC